MSIEFEVGTVYAWIRDQWLKLRDFHFKYSWTKLLYFKLTQRILKESKCCLFQRSIPFAIIAIIIIIIMVLIIHQINSLVDDCLFVAASFDEIKEKIFREAFRCTSNFHNPGLVANRIEKNNFHFLTKQFKTPTG